MRVILFVSLLLALSLNLTSCQENKTEPVQLIFSDTDLSQLVDELITSSLYTDYIRSRKVYFLAKMQAVQAGATTLNAAQLDRLIESDDEQALQIFSDGNYSDPTNFVELFRTQETQRLRLKDEMLMKKEELGELDFNRYMELFNAATKDDFFPSSAEALSAIASTPN